MAHWQVFSQWSWPTLNLVFYTSHHHLSWRLKKRLQGSTILLSETKLTNFNCAWLCWILCTSIKILQICKLWEHACLAHFYVCGWHVCMWPFWRATQVSVLSLRLGGTLVYSCTAILKIWTLYHNNSLFWYKCCAIIMHIAIYSLHCSASACSSLRVKILYLSEKPILFKSQEIKAMCRITLVWKNPATMEQLLAPLPFAVMCYRKVHVAAKNGIIIPHRISANTINPFTGEKMYMIICPSHQV